MTAQRSVPLQHRPEEFAPVGPPWWDARPVAIVGNGPPLRAIHPAQYRAAYLHPLR
jgi:hypothetical protein